MSDKPKTIQEALADVQRYLDERNLRYTIPRPANAPVNRAPNKTPVDHNIKSSTVKPAPAPTAAATPSATPSAAAKPAPAAVSAGGSGGSGSGGPVHGMAPKPAPKSQPQTTTPKNTGATAALAVGGVGLGAAAIANRDATSSATPETSNKTNSLPSMARTQDTLPKMGSGSDMTKVLGSNVTGNKPVAIGLKAGRQPGDEKFSTDKTSKPAAAPKTVAPKTVAPKPAVDVNAKSKAMFQTAQDTNDDSSASFFRADAQRMRELGKKAPFDFSQDEKESGPKGKKKMSESVLINAFLKLQDAKAGNIFEAAKKAKKDWDKDGKVESEKDEVWGSRMRAAKAAGKMEEDYVAEGETIRQSSTNPTGPRSALDRLKDRLGIRPKEQPSKPSDTTSTSDVSDADKEALKKKIEKTNEEVEELDELSKETLGSYIKKSSHDVATRSAQVRGHAMKSKEASDKQDYRTAKKEDERSNKQFKKSWARREGIAKAVDKLTKEEIEFSAEELAHIESIVGKD